MQIEMFLLIKLKYILFTHIIGIGGPSVMVDERK